MCHRQPGERPGQGAVTCWARVPAGLAWYIWPRVSSPWKMFPPISPVSELLVPGGRVVGQPQVAAVGPGGEVRALREHVVPVPGEPQVGDQVGRQQRHHV
jgi:hypothetical protein